MLPQRGADFPARAAWKLPPFPIQAVAVSRWQVVLHEPGRQQSALGTDKEPFPYSFPEIRLQATEENLNRALKHSLVVNNCVRS